MLNRAPATRSRPSIALTIAFVTAAGLTSITPLRAATQIPVLPIYSLAELQPICDQGLARAKTGVAALESLPVAKAGVRTVLHALNRIQSNVEDVEGVFYLFSNVSPEKDIRDATEACLLKYTEFDTDLLQNEKLYARVRAVKVSTEADRKFRKDLLEGFEDTGVALPAAKRARLKQIIRKVEELRQEFERNIRDNKKKLTFTPEEMKGLPEAYLQKAKRDGQGNYVLGFEYPEFSPFMQNADNEEARRRYQFEFTNRGTPRNMEVLAEAVRLRREMASLFGMTSYAQFSLRRKMAGTPQAVHRFLDDVKAQVSAVAARNVDELRAIKARETGKAVADVTVHNWDSAYYRQKLLKTRYSIDREALREYFPSEASIVWVMHISSVLYGIEFRPTTIPVWHPDVKAYEVYDKPSGRFIATLYLDLYPREGKYSHAANFGLVSSSTIEKRAPITVLVANLERKGLTDGELGTLTHEFGHALHHMFSKTPYVAQSGSSLEWDFVEAPSQMYEEWARRRESLSLISRFCNGCKPVDDDLVKRLEASRKVGIGLLFQDQHLLADYDITLYGDTPVDPDATWVRMDSETALGHTPATIFPSSFAHIVGSYAAGYYGYMWSEVLALDMLSAYGKNIMNPAVGRRFRDTILAHGGARPAARMVEEFLGRKPNNAAFIAEITGTRKSN
ncbi:MAG: M3 family metallopeptidase [Betaproteobacteria bacterium]